MILPDFEPSLDALKSGEKPKEIIFRSERTGGFTDNRTTVTECVFTVNYKEEAIDFSHGTYDMGLLQFRMLPKWIPANHFRAAGLAARAIFKKSRSWIRIYPYTSTASGKPVTLVTYDGDDGEDHLVFETEQDAVLWEKVTGKKLKDVRQVQPGTARDEMFEDILPKVIDRNQLKFMPEYKDKKNSVHDLLDILYERENADELIEQLKTKVSPTAVMNHAKENSQDVLYSIGFLMDLVAKAKGAKKQLKDMGVTEKEMKMAWDFMYGGEVPMPNV